MQLIPVRLYELAEGRAALPEWNAAFGVDLDKSVSLKPGCKSAAITDVHAGGFHHGPPSHAGPKQSLGRVQLGVSPGRHTVELLGQEPAARSQSRDHPVQRFLPTR